MKTTHSPKTLIRSFLSACAFVTLPLSLLSCGVPDQAPLPPPHVKRLTPKVAARIAPFAMMAENAYHRKKDRNSHPRYPVEQLGWMQIKPDGSPANTGKPSYSNFLGLAVDIYRHERDGRYAYVFRGTNAKWDYVTANFAAGPSSQYKSADKQFKEFLQLQAAGDPKKVVAIGHSLGGGLAGHQSLVYGVDAIMFNTSPRMFDGLGDEWYDRKYTKMPGPTRLSVEQTGEILAAARSLSTKYPEAMAGQPQYCTVGHQEMSVLELHAMTLLAKDILSLAAKHDPSFSRFIPAN